MVFRTKCPRGHQLYIVEAVVQPKDCPVEQDGFVLEGFDSQDEMVACKEGCYRGDLEET